MEGRWSAARQLKRGLSFRATSPRGRWQASVQGRLELRLGIGWRSISPLAVAAASGVIAAFECCAPNGSVSALTWMAVTPTTLVAPAVNCLKLPDELSFEAGAVMTDMIGTQYSAQKRLGVSGATTLAVFGIGPMGAAGVLIGKARGARVIAVDVLEDRLSMAKDLGADEVVNSGNQDSTERLRDLTDGVGVDVAIDCSGNAKAQNSALDSTRRFGSVAFVGESSSTTINPSDQLIRKQLQVIGAWYFPLSEFEEISRFIVNRQIPVEKMITHRFALDQAAEAFRMFDERKTEKAIFVWD